jgi:MSHA biogenesis protein MshJ
MSVAAYADSIASRVNAMTLRERALVFAAVLGVVALLWDRTLMQPLARRQVAAQSVLEALSQSADGTKPDALLALDAAAQRLNEAVEREQLVRTRLSSVNAELGATAADMLPPERMVRVLRDVLAGQHGLELVSMRNLAPLPLVPPETAATAVTGPYLHPVEIVVAGDYLSVLDYLHALEGLEWRFYWRALELKVDKFPRNVVRIEIATLGTEAQWLGVGPVETVAQGGAR